MIESWQLKLEFEILKKLSILIEIEIKLVQ